MEYTKCREGVGKKERTERVVAAADKGKEIDVGSLLRAPAIPDSNTGPQSIPHMPRLRLRMRPRTLCDGRFNGDHDYTD